MIKLIHFFTSILQVHFEDSQFEANRADGWRKLKPNAIPTLFDVPNPPPRIDILPRKSLYKVMNQMEYPGRINPGQYLDRKY